jgi:hypothetical protein
VPDSALGLSQRYLAGLSKGARPVKEVQHHPMAGTRPSLRHARASPASVTQRLTHATPSAQGQESVAGMLSATVWRYRTTTSSSSRVNCWLIVSNCALT